MNLPECSEHQGALLMKVFKSTWCAQVLPDRLLKEHEIRNFCVLRVVTTKSDQTSNASHAGLLLQPSADPETFSRVQAGSDASCQPKKVGQT